MENEQTLIRQIKAQGLLPLFYHDDLKTCTSVIQSLYNAGVRTVEFTNRGPNALANAKSLISKRDRLWPEMLFGIGTIHNSDTADRFADFLVSPFFDSGVGLSAYHNKIPWVPGCMTPTEIHVAQQANCSLIKLFPGSTLTPSFVSAIKPLFTDLDFIVTGGVDTTKENISSWFSAGVCAVGMGSNLISKQLLESGDYGTLEQNTRSVLDTIQQLNP